MPRQVKKKKVKTIPLKVLSEYLKEDGNGFVILTDMEKVISEHKLDELKTFGVNSKAVNDLFIQELERLAEPLKTKFKVKIILTF